MDLIKFLTCIIAQRAQKLLNLCPQQHIYYVLEQEAHLPQTDALQAMSVEILSIAVHLYKIPFEKAHNSHESHLKVTKLPLFDRPYIISY